MVLLELAVCPHDKSLTSAWVTALCYRVRLILMKTFSFRDNCWPFRKKKVRGHRGNLSTVVKWPLWEVMPTLLFLKVPANKIKITKKYCRLHTDNNYKWNLIGTIHYKFYASLYFWMRITHCFGSGGAFKKWLRLDIWNVFDISPFFSKIVSDFGQVFFSRL